MTRGRRDSSTRRSRIGSLFRKRTVRPLDDEADADSDADIPLVVPVRQVSLQQQMSVPEDDASGIYLAARGNIQFWKNFGYETQPRPFVCVRHDMQPEQLAGVLVHDWGFTLPRIALVVVSHVGPLTRWAIPRQLDNFRKGLIKAANTTDMWILTHGLNVGISKEIGEAVSQELRRREAQRCHKHPGRTRLPPPLTLLGVTREDQLAHADILDGRQPVVQIENEGNRPEDGKYELQPDHSHYVLVRDDTVNKTGLNYLLLRLEQHMRTLGDTDQGEGGVELPLVALLVAGGNGCAKLLLGHLQKQMPVLVLEGSGGLADLLAFAYHEVRRRGPAVWDTEFVESFLKPELAAKVCLLHSRYRENTLARHLLRDKVVECVRLAWQQPGLFTVVDMHSQASNLRDLDEILLKAVFKAQRPEHSFHQSQMKKDLLLTLDWNCPEVATSEVFLKDPSCKFQVDRSVFEEALLRPDREEFVRLFLERGFKVHKYLTPRRLKFLFQKVQDEQFFRSVCWEGALGRSLFSRLGKNFVEKELNWLVETLTGLKGFLDPQELWLNAALGIYTQDPSAAERKALVTLALWAAFTQRTQLGRLLWQSCDQPIHLALLVSRTYARLADYVHEGHTREALLQTSSEFAGMAAGVLDLSYQEGTCRAYEMLSEESPEWGYRTAVDLAAESQNRTFLAHPCCQKWITNLFMGRLSVRDLTWGVFTCPLWLKIVLCAFLLFPMYIWVRFKSDPHEMEYKEDMDMEEEKEEREAEDEALIQGDSQVVDMKAPKGSLVRNLNPEVMTHMLQEKELFVPSPPPPWSMVYQMWSAPITKFWTFQIFYIGYLALFSVAVLLPSCGNPFVDLAVCAWTAMIALESLRRTYVLHKRYMGVSLLLRCLEVALMGAFVCLYLLGRVVQPGQVLSPYSVKVLLCAALLCFYYRQIVIYLPISPTLGPLLYKVRLMVVEDFVNFMRMALLVIISGGIVAHALLYPDYPFSAELLRRTFHRAWFSLFLTPIADLEGDARCHRMKYTNHSAEECRVSEYTDYTCPNPGIWPYIFVIQYLVLLKLILLTLLYALFSHTAHKIEAASDDIWKFQRYQLVVDFQNRLCLPPPLNALSYLLGVLQFLWNAICCRVCGRSCCRRRTHQLDGPAVSDLSKGRLSERDYSYWRQLAQQYIHKQQEEKDSDSLAKRQAERLHLFLDDMDNQRNMVSQLRGQVQELQRMVGKSFANLETFRQTEGGAMMTRPVHTLSRLSPYPSTRVLRFPVPDKYVAWEVMWLEYDPVAYSRPRPDFPGHLQPHVDEDILSLQLKARENSECPMPSLSWNCVSTSPAGVSISRQSWILDPDGCNLVYKLDQTGVPMNPLGRTGLRGRGALPRWGPNHYVLFIISRWQRAKVHLVGGKGLEILVMRIFRPDQFSLPGDFVPGERKYDMMKRLFKTEDSVPFATTEDVKLFFQGCSMTEESSTGSSLQCEVTQQGYMDDPMNTDHSWREIELWNVHFPQGDCLQEKLQSQLLWRLVTEDLFSKLPAGQSALLHEAIQSLQASVL